jgi:hypothetical protein
VSQEQLIHREFYLKSKDIPGGGRQILKSKNQRKAGRFAKAEQEKFVLQASLQ